MELALRRMSHQRRRRRKGYSSHFKEMRSPSWISLAAAFTRSGVRRFFEQYMKSLSWELFDILRFDCIPACQAHLLLPNTSKTLVGRLCGREGPCTKEAGQVQWGPYLRKRSLRTEQLWGNSGVAKVELVKVPHVGTGLHSRV
jgi:hypothetical protein